MIYCELFIEELSVISNTLNQKTFYSQFYISIFLGNIFFTKFLLNLRNYPSSTTHEFYKGILQNLTQKKLEGCRKNILAQFDPYNLINKEGSTLPFSYVSSISSQFKFC